VHGFQNIPSSNLFAFAFAFAFAFTLLPTQPWHIYSTWIMRAKGVVHDKATNHLAICEVISGADFAIGSTGAFYILFSFSVTSVSCIFLEAVS
jgi:hypothetical protein